MQALIFVSGRQDSNLRPPGPKPGAMTGLRYAPNLLTFCYCYQFDRYQTRLTIINLRGGSEIRTRGTVTRTTV